MQTFGFVRVNLLGVDVFKNSRKTIICIGLDLAWTQLQKLLHVDHLFAQFGRRRIFYDT